MAQHLDEQHPDFVGPPAPSKAKTKSKNVTIKLDMPPAVAQTMRELSRLSGMSQRRIMRHAMDHVIKIYALHYGLEEFATFAELMPPEKLTTAHVRQMQAQEAQAQGQVQPQQPQQHQQPQYVPPQHIQQPAHQPMWSSPAQPLHPYAPDGIQRDEFTIQW